MGKINHGWLTIYIFYGIIFFLFGWCGYLFSNENRVNNFEKQAANFTESIKNLKDYSIARDFGLESDTKAVIASAKEFTPLILYAYPVSLKHNLPDLAEKIQLKMLANFNKVKIAALPDHQNWENGLNELLIKNDSRQEKCILIGYDLPYFSGETYFYKMTLILPEFLADSLASQIVLSYSEIFPAITLQNHGIKTWRILDYTWEEALAFPETENISAASLLKAVDLLIDILRQNFGAGTKI